MVILHLKYATFETLPIFKFLLKLGKWKLNISYIMINAKYQRVMISYKQLLLNTNYLCARIVMHNIINNADLA